MRIALLTPIVFLLLAAPAVARPTAIVALGDSFISGEGGRWLGNGSERFGTRSGTDRAAHDCGPMGCAYDAGLVYGTSEADGCHRSDVAPIESVPIAVDDRVNLACSGAVARDLWPGGEGGTSHFGEPPQADQLAAVARRDQVQMVVVTVGANDIDFGGLVAHCALDWARSPSADPVTCHRHAEARIEAALPTAVRATTAALSGVRRTMRADGYRRSDYRLVAMGYASPFPEGQWFRYPEDGWSRLREGGCPIWNADADWAEARAVVDLADALRTAARATGAEYLDLADAFDGHQLCDRRSARVGPGGPSPLAAEWFRRLSFTQGSTRESLHPDAYGQRVIGACLGLLWDRPRGDYACGDAPGEYLEGVHLRALGRNASTMSSQKPALCARRCELIGRASPEQVGDSARSRAAAGPSSARPGGRRGRSRELGARPNVRGDVRPRSRAPGGARGRRRSAGRRWLRGHGAERWGDPRGGGGAGSRRTRAR